MNYTFTDNLGASSVDIAFSYDNLFPEKQLKDYENMKVGPTFNHISELISVVHSEESVILHLVNGNSGFGSQMTLFMQNLYYFHENYPNIICLPSFSQNAENFKYHESCYNNSFFLYFSRKNDIEDLSKYKQYFLRLGVIENYPFFGCKIPVMIHEPARRYIQYFNDNYELIKRTEIMKNINNIKSRKRIGIHIRSLAQKRLHQNEYLEISIQDRLQKVKNQLDKVSDTRDEYSVYIITDVSSYIDVAKSVFSNVYYFENITRISEETDIMSSLPLDQSGYKLGSDILNECFALSLCDKIYVSNSNILFLVSIMNPEIIMEEY
jgi:hypothetical protein